VAGLDPHAHGFKVATYRQFLREAGYRLLQHDALCFNTIQRNVLQRWARNERLPLPPRFLVDAVFGLNRAVETAVLRLGWLPLLWMQMFVLSKAATSAQSTS
jgi:hypothetical protein